MLIKKEIHDQNTGREEFVFPTYRLRRGSSGGEGQEGLAVVVVDAKSSGDSYGGGWVGREAGRRGVRYRTRLPRLGGRPRTSPLVDLIFGRSRLSWASRFDTF